MRFNTIKNINFFFLILIFSMSVFFNSGCFKSKKSTVEQGIEEQVLHRGNSAEPEDLDPHITSGISEYNILSALYEGLVDFHPETLEIIPGAAESWEILNEGKKYIFYLRKNAKWSNGDPVTAHDFVFSFKRILSPKLGAPYAYTFYPIKGAKAYHRGELTDFSQVALKANSDYELQIELNHSLPYLLSLLPHMAWYPLHKKSILQFGAIDERGTSWTRAGNLVSNGPFKLAQWEISKKIVLEKNPYYWDKDIIRLNAIHFYPIDNLNAEERAFRTGQLHITDSIPLTKIDRYKGSKVLSLNPYFSTYTYIFNTKKAPFDDVRVRKAFSLAIDREAIVKKITKKEESPAHSFTPPRKNGYVPTTELEENIQKAKKLLAQAGYPEGKDLPAFKLVYNTSDAHRSIAEALQHMWSKNLNAKVELINQEWKVYLKSRLNNDFHLIRFGWVGDYLDPNAFLSVFHSASENNFSGWSSQEFDQLLDLSSRTLEVQKRFHYLNQAEHILIDELPIVPIYYYNTAYLVHPSVKGWFPNLLNYHNYKYVYLEKETTEL